MEGEGRVIIDTGSDPHLLTEVARYGVDLVIYTHYHRDHTSFFHLFKGVPWAAHFLDVPPLESVEAFHEYTGIKVNNNQMKEVNRDYRKLTPLRKPEKLSCCQRR